MAIAPPASAPIALPSAPRNVEDTGLPFSFVCDLVLKVLYFNGGMLAGDLAAHVCLPFGFIETTLRFLADEAYCSSTGMNTAGLKPQDTLGAGIQWLLSTTGRQRARELLDLSQYAGPAPVPLTAYRAMTLRQNVVETDINRDRLAQAFAGLVLPERVLDSLGPALCARQATFLYGPPGNGKTSVAEACATLLGPPLFIPRALYVHGEVIRYFDPIHHTPVGGDLPPHDTRWLLTSRPVVKVGGELIPRMLELGFDQTLGFYEAPLQLKANGGLFLVDDFGRQQQLSPRDLLNRLIVPLEKGLDYLNIARAGTSVSVPFTCQLMLSTNLRPQNLMDEAFLRRVRYKVLVPDPTEDEYKEIWRRLCAKEHIERCEEAIEHLVQKHYREPGRALHGSHPRDLLSHMVHGARYRGEPMRLSVDLIDRACETYFVSPDES